MGYNESREKVKELIHSMLKAESPKEDIDLIANIDKELDAMDADHAKEVKDRQDIQGLYIDLVKKSGNTEKPKDQEDEKPMSLLEIAQEQAKQEKK